MSRRFQGGESSEILSQSTVKNEDMIQCRHEPGTINDSDKAIPLSVVQSCPVATCETAGGTAAKVGVVNNFSDFTLLNGREVLVYFASGNTADNPTFNLNNTGAFPLALENQLSTVSIGSGCWGDGVFLHLKYVDITVSNTRIQKWLICGHRIASQSSTQTTYADGQGRTNTVASGNMQSVTSNAVAQILRYKNDWLIGQVIEVDEFFQGQRLKHYCSQILNVTGDHVDFQLPERPNNIVNMRISVVDQNGNVLQDGYCDDTYGFYLRCAWLEASNTVVVTWTGWSALASITLFFTYR